MTTRSRFVLPLLLLVWTGSVHSSEKQHKGSHKTHESGPPAEVCSRDKKYCVHMIPKPGHPDECTLRVSASGTTVAEFQTMGYLPPSYRWLKRVGCIHPGAPVLV